MKGKKTNKRSTRARAPPAICSTPLLLPAFFATGGTPAFYRRWHGSLGTPVWTVKNLLELT
jgi:hypothetical protein